VRAAAAILLACAACAAPAKQEPAASPDEVAKLTEAATNRAVQARKAWEAAGESEKLVLERYRTGQATAAEASRATEARLRAERDLAVRDLAVEEIGITGRSPDRHLNAPAVEGQDFVLRWLEIEEVYAGRIRDNLADQHASADALVKAGRASFDEVLPLDGATALARAEQQRWRDLAALRRRMAANAIESKQAYEEASEIIYSSDVEMARIRVRTASRMVKFLAARRTAGSVDESEVLAAESELLRLQNEQHEAEMGRGPGLPER